MINGGLWDFFIAGIENSVWEVDGLFFQFCEGKELVIRHSISPNFLGHLSLNFSLKSMLNCSSLFCSQGRFGVLKEIVVSDKCSSTVRIYKGSILNYTHATSYKPVTKCGWECEQCSHTFFGHFQAADVSVVSSYPSLNAKWRKSTPTSVQRIYDQARPTSSSFLWLLRSVGNEWNE